MRLWSGSSATTHESFVGSSAVLINWNIFPFARESQNCFLFSGISLNQQVNLGRINIFSILDLPMEEYDIISIYLRFLVYPLVKYYNFLHIGLMHLLLDLFLCTLFLLLWIWFFFPLYSLSEHHCTSDLLYVTTLLSNFFF